MDKSRMISPKDSICLMPFISLGTKPDGAARICCMAPMLEAKEGGKLVSVAGTSLDKTWNGETFRSVRKRMIAGEQLPECSACWKEELAGKISKRIKENTNFAHHMDRIDKCDADGRLDSLPVHLDLRLGNTCNLKCRTCNPLFSSAITADLRHHLNEWETDPVLGPLNKQIYLRTINSIPWTDDPSFWEKIDSLAETAEEIYISGGEPTLVPKLFDFLERCIARGHTKARIRLESNMTILPKRLTDALSQFNEVIWGGSVDALGRRNDWLRHPSKFEDIEKNICKIISIGTPFNVRINCTVSAYNVLMIPELYLWSKDLGVDFMVDILHNPAFMQIENLPDKIKLQALDKISNLMNLLDEKDLHGFNYIISCLNKPGSPERWEELLHHSKMIDRWHNQNMIEIFPEFAEFIK